MVFGLYRARSSAGYLLTPAHSICTAGVLARDRAATLSLPWAHTRWSHRPSPGSCPMPCPMPCVVSPGALYPRPAVGSDRPRRGETQHKTAPVARRARRVLHTSQPAHVACGRVCFRVFMDQHHFRPKPRFGAAFGLGPGCVRLAVAFGGAQRAWSATVPAGLRP